MVPVDLMSVSAALRAAFVVFLGLIFKFCFDLYKHRSRVAGLPKPPWNPLLGNIITMGKLVASLPPNIHPHTFVHYLQEKYDLPDIFYLDTWPVGDQICAIVHPDVAHSVTVEHSLPKHASINRAIWPITGFESLVALQGKEHKKWRRVFNPGFSSGHLMTLVSGIVDDCLVFVDILGKHADAQDIFALEEAATRVTVDIIGRVVLDVPMHAQTTENDFVSAFRNQLLWLPNANEMNPFKLFNPVRPIVFKYNEWRMNRFLTKIMTKRFEKFAEKRATAKGERGRPIIDLALDNYQENGINDGANLRLFEQGALDHIKVFMFAGHDTTSSTICYVAYALARNPECLERFRLECDEIFGPDSSQTAQRIKNQPHLINQMPYTVAIIRETLRLWPAASSVRSGEPGFFLQHDGELYPTEGTLTWPVAHAIHLSPKFWPEPNNFIPDRWLMKENHPLYPPKSAWRAFEHGPRNCIGQELAMIEIKITMALMLRMFTIEVAYDELDKANRRRGVTKTPDGERAYQVLIATAKPVDGMPTRVKRK